MKVLFWTDFDSEEGHLSQFANDSFPDGNRWASLRTIVIRKPENVPDELASTSTNQSTGIPEPFSPIFTVGVILSTKSARARKASAPLVHALHMGCLSWLARSLRW